MENSISLFYITEYIHFSEYLNKAVCRFLEGFFFILCHLILQRIMHIRINSQELDIRKEYGLNIIAIENERNTNIEVSPQYRLEKEDVIVVIGKVNNIDRFEENM